jgi:pimeloyl-ACP methyl ester carboxylesterase
MGTDTPGSLGRARRVPRDGVAGQNARMTATIDQPSSSGRGCLPRLVKVVLVLVVIGALLFVAGAWYFSGVIGSDALKVKPATPELVTTVDRSTVDTVSLVPNSKQPETSTPGTFGLVWSDGWGVLGTIVPGQGASTVTRKYSEGTGGTPADGTPAEVNETVYEGNPKQALGLDFADVSITGDLGPMPAYLVPAPKSTWVIYVHGKGSNRAEGYRALKTMQQLGYPGLLITYRNDVGAPKDPTGEYGYGLREWKDLQAAVKYALSNGADHVVLAGWSMGGAIVGQFLDNSALTDKVSGVILDSPALNLPDAIELGASQRSLPLGLPIPSALTSAALWTADRRFPTNLSDAISTAAVEKYTGPTFVAQGTADETTPASTTSSVVAARTKANHPTLYLLVKGARHVESWNVARTKYVDDLTAFSGELAS